MNLKHKQWNQQQKQRQESASSSSNIAGPPKKNDEEITALREENARLRAKQEETQSSLRDLFGGDGACSSSGGNVVLRIGLGDR